MNQNDESPDWHEDTVDSIPVIRAPLLTSPPVQQNRFGMPLKLKLFFGVAVAVVAAFLGVTAVSASQSSGPSPSHGGAPAPHITTSAPTTHHPKPTQPHTSSQAQPPTTRPYTTPQTSAPPQTSDPYAVVRAYFGALSARDYPVAWGLLSPSFQSWLGGYDKWHADRSDIAWETVTYISQSGDTVTVALHQVRDSGAVKDVTATFTVDNGVITEVN